MRRYFLNIGLALLLSTSAFARNDAGQWDQMDPELKHWYESLIQPDSPVSCCGEADAYYCDELHVKGDKSYCNITDDRDIPSRPKVDVGTEIELPPNKMMDGKKSHGNPTGHSIVFLSRGGYVYCFIMSSGT